MQRDSYPWQYANSSTKANSSFDLVIVIVAEVALTESGIPNADEGGSHGWIWLDTLGR